MSEQVSHRFLRLAGKVDEKETKPTLADSLAAFAELPNVSLRPIVDALADAAHSDDALLPDEFLYDFVEMFQGPKLLVQKFVEKLKPVEGVADKESTKHAKADLDAFIAGYSQSTITLHTWIRQQQRAYPTVDFRAIFDDNMQSIMAWEIEKTATIIAQNKYQGIFARDPERFILDFFTNRIISIKEDASSGHQEYGIEQRALRKLIEFINEQGYPLEKLYMLLYKELMAMRKMKDNPEAIKASTRMAIEACKVFDGDPLFSDDFNFDRLFEEQIKPAILDVREEKIRENKHLRLVDITDLSPAGLSQVLIPPKAIEPVLAKVRSIKTEEDFMRVLRMNFNYQREQDSKESKIAMLSDEELMRTLEEHLDQVRDLIKYMLKRGLQGRTLTESQKNDFRFHKEIYQAKNVRDLFRWLASPEDFTEEHQHHKRKEFKYIRFECRRMLELLLLYRRYAFREDVKRAQENRKILEDQMMDDLQIENIAEKEIQYRIRVKVTKEKKLQPGKEPEYEVITDPNALNVNPEIEHTDYEPGPQGEGGTDGVWYRYYPVEGKKFFEVDVAIPTDNGDRKRGKVLIYRGDGQLIHCKSLNSYISSMLRGKKPSDLLRWMIVTDDKEMSDALRNHLYENYSTGNYIVIKDNAEGRKMTRKPDPKSTGNSENFKKQRLYSAALYATVPLKNGPEGHEHSHLGFETQIQELDQMLIANSDHTLHSHDRVYTPEREFGNIFQYLFPPALYGQRYADYLLQGYDGKQAEGA